MEIDPQLTAGGCLQASTSLGKRNDARPFKNWYGYFFFNAGLGLASRCPPSPPHRCGGGGAMAALRGRSGAPAAWPLTAPTRQCSGREAPPNWCLSAPFLNGRTCWSAVLEVPSRTTPRPHPIVASA